MLPLTRYLPNSIIPIWAAVVEQLFDSINQVVRRLQPNVGYWCGCVLRNKERDALAAPLIELAGRLSWEFRLGETVREVARAFSGKEDSLSGFTGTLRVRGNLDPFRPLLIAGSLVHVGLRPHLDRGRYILAPVADRAEAETLLAP